MNNAFCRSFSGINGSSRISPNLLISSWVITKICPLGVGLVSNASKVFLLAGVFMVAYSFMALALLKSTNKILSTLPALISSK